MNQICRTSKIVSRIVAIFFWLSVVLIGIATIATTVMLLFPNIGIWETMDFSVNIGNFEFYLNAENYSYNQFHTVFIITLLNLVVFGSFLCYMLKTLIKILRPMTEGKPFDNSVSISIKKIAWAELVYGIISQIFQYVTNSVVFKTFNIETLLSEQVSSSNITVAFDLTFFIWFAILLLLSHIFRYGEELQKLSDETV